MNTQTLYIIITPFFPSSDNFRGSFVYDQARAIERNSKYKVVVFKPTSILQPESDYVYEGIKVYRFKTLETPSMLFNGLFNKINAKSFINRINEIGIDVANVKVVHGHTAMFASYSLALKKIHPSILTVVQHHDPDPFGLRSGRLVEWGANARFKANVALNLFKQIDIHLCISKYVENNLMSFPDCSSFDVDKLYLSILKKVKKISPFEPKKSIVLYNGVDTGIFYPNPIPHDKLTIGCIGNIGDWKNQITLLRAINLLVKDGEKDIKAILIGSGSGEEECRQFIYENKLEEFVEIQKEVNHADLPKKFNSFDLFVLPSYFEGFGCVFTEAAACGVPFIACEGQGATEYLREDDAKQWTIKPFDYEDLAQKIKLFKNRPRQQSLNNPFDINILINRYLQELESI